MGRYGLEVGECAYNTVLSGILLKQRRGCKVVMGWYGVDLGVCVHVLYVLHTLKKRGNHEGKLWWEGMVLKGNVLPPCHV